MQKTFFFSPPVVLWRTPHSRELDLDLARSRARVVLSACTALQLSLSVTATRASTQARHRGAPISLILLIDQPESPELS